MADHDIGTPISSPSPSHGRNPIKSVTKALSSCFGSTDQPHSTPILVESGDFRPTTASPSQDKYFRSSQRRQGAGMNFTGRSSCPVESVGTGFSMAEIQKATKNFSHSLKIGKGGTASVYKGQFADGTLVAVKRMRTTMYGTCPNAEFKNEIQTLSQIEHLNLVKLHGYLQDKHEMIVIFEYVPNGTLREHLDCERGQILDLASRVDIAIDVAHAVTYLHMYSDHPIIHRDIKSSNILLTENLRAKVADFGFARLGATEPGDTHVSTQVKGTAGYVDPEYLKTFQLTEKSDVYSFGVLLVELLTGRRPVDPKKELNERVTTKWAMKKFREGKGLQILDPNLQPDPATTSVVEQILELALLCLAPTKNNRPSMQRCAEILWSIRKNYREHAASLSIS